MGSVSTPSPVDCRTQEVPRILPPTGSPVQWPRGTFPTHRLPWLRRSAGRWFGASPIGLLDFGKEEAYTLVLMLALLKYLAIALVILLALFVVVEVFKGRNE